MGSPYGLLRFLIIPLILCSKYLQNVVAQNLHFHLIRTKVLDIELELEFRLATFLDNRHTRLHVHIEGSAVRIVWKQLEHLVPHVGHFRLHRLHLEHGVLKIVVEEVESCVADIVELLQ